MQAYGPSFARIYNLRWGRFAARVGPLLLDYYEKATPEAPSKTLLDLCCGAGHLAHLALKCGYQVTGIDLSASMLEHARQNNLEYIVAEQARFIHADAADFQVDSQVGLAVSTYDALNHLPDLESLKSCFRSVHAALQPGGLFIFDLNTARGLQHWNTVAVEDTPEIMLVNRGIFDQASGRATVYISGFSRREDGLYERFEETVYNTVFDLGEVTRELHQAGFQNVHAATAESLAAPLSDPEQESRVFFIARKPE